MLDSLHRHLELYEARGEPYVVCDGKVYRPYREAVRPFGPITLDYTLSRENALAVMRQLGRSMVLCTDGFHQEPVGDWYAVICDRFTSLEEYSAKRRSEMRRGLSNCDVQRVDAEFLASHGYPVYVCAFKRYRGAGRPAWDEEGFRRYLLASRGFDDVVHYWGAFHQGHLVALGINNIFDRIEATYWMIKMDPDYTPQYPAYALLYRMNEYYLRDQGFEYVNDGWRSIVHATGIQDFLIRKFGFRKAYSRLQVTYVPWLAAAVALAYPFRAQIGRFSAKARTLLTSEEIRRSCDQHRVPPGGPAGVAS